MAKLRVMTILGTRPEIIRLSATIKACERYFDHLLVHTGQNYDYTLNQIFFEQLGLRAPDYYLDAAGANLGETMGNIIAKSYALLASVKPDAVLILGDTNSALAAISAKRLKIPIFHMEAGNRCFDQNVPEETNRRIVDHISDINLAYTEHARRYLLSEGIRKDHVFVTGSPMREVLDEHIEAINANLVLKELGLLPTRYFLVSAHREENVDDPSHFLPLMEALNQLAAKYLFPVVYSVHPRTQKRIDEHGFQFHPLVRLMKPVGFIEYNALQLRSFCVLSDSGTLSEESALLGFAGVLIRTSTERPEALDAGTVVVGGTTTEEILQAVELSRAMKDDDAGTSLPPDYADDCVSTKIVKIIQSYTRIVDRDVWRK